jgi:hypothetical protein
MLNLKEKIYSECTEEGCSPHAMGSSNEVGYSKFWPLPLEENSMMLTVRDKDGVFSEVTWVQLAVWQNRGVCLPSK